MSDIAKNVSTSAGGGGYAVSNATQFFRWWKTQLWECLPSGIRDAAVKSARPLMVSLADDAVWPERSDLKKPYKISQTQYLSGNPEKTREVALVLGERMGLRRVVEFPIAVEERLDQVLAYELDRLTPLRADELYYDHRLLSRAPTRGVCLVEVVAAPKARANEVIANAKAMGGDVTRLLLSTSDVDHGVDLLRRAKAADAPTSDMKRWITRALLALCALLTVALVAYPIFKKRQHVIALLPIEASERSAAEAASVIQRQLEKQRNEYNHVLQRKHASPIAVQVLEDLSKRLPDDTWAQTFEIKAMANAPAGQHPREVIVQGETGSGAKLLQLVQESTMLKDPVLKAAMTRVSPTAERFHFSGELLNVAPPPGLALADAASVLSVPMQVTPNAANAGGAPGTSPASGASTAPAAAPGAASGATPSTSPTKSADGATPTAPSPSQPAATTTEKGAATKPADSVVQPPGAPSKSTGASVDSSKKSTPGITSPVPQVNQPGTPGAGYGAIPVNPSQNPSGGPMPAIPSSPNAPSVERKP